MLDARLDTMRHVQSVCEVPPRVALLRLLVPGIWVGVFIDPCCEVDGVEVMHRVISATPELISEGEGVNVSPGILEATELPP